MLTTAALLPDLLFPFFLSLGLEQLAVGHGDTALTALVFPSYPYTHSLAAGIGWAAVLAALYWLRTRHERGALVLSLAVLSHWVLDAITHRPDMPLYAGGPVVGLGLWDSALGTVVIEGGLFVAAIWAYSSATRASDRTGRWAFVAFIAFLALLYWKFVAGPAPHSVKMFAWVGLASWLFPLWAWWIDRHRTMAEESNLP